MDISIRELKANPSRAIALMQQGTRVRITSHRKVVAELARPGTLPNTEAEHEPEPEREISAEDAAAIARLMASGLVVEPATQPLRVPTPLRLSPSPDGKTLSDLVIEGRGPR